MALFEALVVLHVATGAVGLTAFWGPIATKKGAAKPAIAIDETGKGFKDLGFEGRRRVEEVEICPEGIGFGHRSKRHHRHGSREPHIEVEIERWLRHEVEDRG